MKKILLLTLIMSLLSTMMVFAEEETIETVGLPTLYQDETEETVPVPTLFEDETSEPQPELIMDGGAVVEVDGDRNTGFNECVVTIDESNIEFDVKASVVDGVVYLPLRFTLEKLGYEVFWNGETESVDIKQGAKFTTIYIGKNSYFKNRMAPSELSGAPFITDGRTLVPIEFFYLILDESFVVDDHTVVFNHDMMAIHSGYIQSIEYDETGGARVTISSKEVSEGMEDLTIIHTNSSFTIVQKNLEEGLFINVLTSPVMAMSIPGQTAGYVIY